MDTLSTQLNTQEEIITRAVDVLRSGGLVVYPSDTIYGIACDPTNSDAIQKLLDYKRQRNQKPISIAVADRVMAEEYVLLNDQAVSLYQTLLPGPYTIVSKSLHHVDRRCETLHGTLGVRIPDHELVVALCQAFGKPITASSANASYQKQPRTIDDILTYLGHQQSGLIDLIIDAGRLPMHDPSTVLDTTVGELAVLRQSVDATFFQHESHVSHNVEETVTFGRTMMQKYMHYVGYKSILFCLMGEMGVGKTHFTKGLAQELQIQQELTSPTFVLSQEYAIPHKVGSYSSTTGAKFYHMDLWRIRDLDELEGLNFKEFVEAGHVFAIEWADKALDLLKTIQHDAVVIGISIDYGESESQRKLSVRLL